MSVFSETNTVTVGGLIPGSIYAFQIRARNERGYGPYSHTIYFSTLAIGRPRKQHVMHNHMLLNKYNKYIEFGVAIFSLCRRTVKADSKSPATYDWINNGRSSISTGCDCDHHRVCVSKVCTSKYFTSAVVQYSSFIHKFHFVSLFIFFTLVKEEKALTATDFRDISATEVRALYVKGCAQRLI